MNRAELIAAMAKKMSVKVTRIATGVPLGGSLNKDRDNVEKNINLGYLDSMKAYNRYEGIRYYFNANYMFPNAGIWQNASRFYLQSLVFMS